MHVVTVTFEIEQRYGQDFHAEVLKNASASLQEPGCLTFDVATDATGERFFLYEVYSSARAYEDHLATLHFLSFAELTAPWIIVKEVEEFRFVGPRSPAELPAEAEAEAEATP